MNTQQIFDRACIGVLKQGVQSARNTNPASVECLYYGTVDDKQVKCAVGHLILEEFYSSDLEDSSMRVDPVLIKAIECSVGRSLDNKEWLMLYDLQLAHDVPDCNPNEFTRVFFNSIKPIAKEYNLKVPFNVRGESIKSFLDLMF